MTRLSSVTGIVIFFIALIISGCIHSKEDFRAKPVRQGNVTTQLKLNGVYVGKATTLGYESVLCFIFYSNGLVKLYDPIFYLHGINNKDSVKQQVSWTVKMWAKERQRRSMKEGGGFEIINNKIVIQTFRADPDGGTPSLFEYKGYIVNDTTIHIQSCSAYYSNWCRQNFSLHFVQMAKADSINNFMKKEWFWR